MGLFPLGIQFLATLTKPQASSARYSVVGFNIVAFGAFIVVVVNLCPG